MTRTGKALGGIVAAAALTLGLAGCAAGTSETPTADEGATPAESAIECSIGMVQINQAAAFFTEMNKGAEEAAAAAGCELTISNANNDSAKQASDIENFVTQGVTGLIVVAIDVNAVLPAIRSAIDAGIKVVAIDSSLEDGYFDTFVGVDNAVAGAVIGQWAIDNGYADGSYGVVGAKNSFIQNQREDSFRASIDAAGAVFTQSVSGDNVQEQAADAATNLVTAQPGLNFIYTTGEPATVGVVAALGANSNTKVIGWDLTAEVIAGLDSGTVVGVVQQDPYQEGIEGVNEIFALLNGAIAKGFIDVPIAVVTTENVEPYRAIFPAG